jgi:GH35 family endo-1,4-beta-xylanase
MTLKDAASAIGFEIGAAIKSPTTLQTDIPYKYVADNEFNLYVAENHCKMYSIINNSETDYTFGGCD